ncbi:MAG TPA: multiheme c-type cytochrome [Pirellulales bacterium]|nr:multiheme c-type cytochrome [Pirellulales bacterium]
MTEPRRGLPMTFVRALGVLAAFLAAVALPAALAAAQPPEKIATGKSSSSGVRWMGSPSCSAQACHGDVKPDAAAPNVWGNEHTIWIESDRHSRAYEVLCDKLSRQIAERLKIPAAHEAQQCLACHAPRHSRRSEHPAAVNGPFAPGEGVGCEACHGPAEKWLEPHTRGKLSADQKTTLGMNDTADLFERAKLCAECHVGSPGGDQLPARDVNHDLIAAGHPPLRYEFGTFLAKMPKHWTERRRDPVAPDKVDTGFDARVWAVGQAVSAAAALELLADRVERSSSRSARAPWPEFSEYDCFACHHDLRSDRWRTKPHRPSGDGQRQLGVPTWGTWYYPPLPRLSPIGPTPRAELPGMLAELRVLMRSPAADRPAVAAQAGEAARSLGLFARDLARARYDRAAIQRLLAAAADPSSEVAPANWNEAAQCYLELVALRHANLALKGQRILDDQAFSPLLRQLYEDLSFSPLDAAPAARRDDSPRDFDPNEEVKVAGGWVHASAREQATDAVKAQFMGVTICADCHEKPSEFRKRQGSTKWVRLTESAIWLKQDKHALAYQRIDTEPVRKWASLIGIKEPTTDPRCLSCHCDEMPDSPNLDDFNRRQGVTCESCHGAGSRYRDEHAKPTWRVMPASEKRDHYGMIDVRDPRERTKQCLSCHLGNVEQGKIVTHAMYAAGHPPLTGFEVRTFGAQMPPHWRPLEDKLPFLDDKAQAKAICDQLGYRAGDLRGVQSVVVGGVETLRVSLELAAAQATQASPRNGWPDFAQYDCAMCHHKLRVPSWRQQRPLGGRPGMPGRRAWPLVLAELGIRHVTREKPRETRRLTKEFRERFDRFDALFRADPFAEPRDQEQLAAAGHDWAVWLEEHVAAPLQTCRYGREEALELLRDLCDLAQGPDLDYDSARQVTWAFDAIYSAYSDGRDPVRARLDELARQLGIGLPVPPNAGEIIDQERPSLAVPGRDDPDAFRAGFAELAKRLPAKATP